MDFLMEYPMVYPIPWMINLHFTMGCSGFPSDFPAILTDAMAKMAPTSSCQCRSSAERSWIDSPLGSHYLVCSVNIYNSTNK